MRVVIVGSGAVGSLFAAHLGQLEDVKTWVYDTDQAHVDAINEHGLRLSGVGDIHSRVAATADPASLPSCDFAIVGTKSMHTSEAIQAVAHALAAGGAALSVQNGIGNEETLAEHVPRVIRGTTFPAGRVIAPGHVAWDVAGDTWIGPFEPSPAELEEVERLAETLTRAGMPTKALPDARGAQWTKLIFNAATNPIGALTGLSHGRVCEFEPTRRVVSGLIVEGVQVADALGVQLDSDPEELVDHAADVAYEHKASMLQDIEARRQTEIEYLNEGIVRFGRDTGVPTPLNQAVAALVKGLESSWEPARDPHPAGESAQEA